MFTNKLVVFLFLFTWIITAQKSEMIVIKKGSFIPLYGAADKKPMVIESFELDVYPVTNQQYLDFVKKFPNYRRSTIKGIFSDKSYLSQWKSDLDYGLQNKPNAPITNISWFAAKKYCECQGKRLPTMDEWEFVAMADAVSTDARKKPGFTKYIMSWYEQTNTSTNAIGQTPKNYWGVYDMHGLVWEWTSDFNSIFLSGESRKDKSSDANLFCGSASVNATDLMNYAAFMRYAFRGSLKASYTTKNLGFRCAKDL